MLTHENVVSDAAGFLKTFDASFNHHRVSFFFFFKWNTFLKAHISLTFLWSPASRCALFHAPRMSASHSCLWRTCSREWCRWDAARANRSIDGRDAVTSRLTLVDGAIRRWSQSGILPGRHPTAAGRHEDPAAHRVPCRAAASQPSLRQSEWDWKEYWSSEGNATLYSSLY